MKYLNNAIHDKVRMLTDELSKSLISLDADELETASIPIVELREDVREAIQENLRGTAEQIITKLKKDENLSYEDISYIEKWIVGDAEYYTEIENNFNDWVQECKRLQSLLNGYTNPGIEKEEQATAGDESEVA